MKTNQYRILALAGLLVSANPLSAAEEPVTDPSAKTGGTHEKAADIKVTSADGRMKLQTLTVDGEGRILGLVAPPRGYGASVKDASGEIHVFTPEGKPSGVWKVSFHAHSINSGPDGTVYVAGDGKVAKFSKDGKDLGMIELPHIKELLADKDGMKQQAEDQLKRQKDSFAQAKKSILANKKAIEDKKEADRTDLEKRQLEQFEQILKSYEQSEKFYATQSVDSIVQQITSRLRIINGIAVSEKDLFIVCGETKGYGYAVWRMTHDFKDPKKIVSGVVGCCGQMDVQVHGANILLAENTKHRFAKYDRNGKELGGWGKRGLESDPTCFGGCCNPMNLRTNKDGDVFTAESEGIIKRFSAKGDFLGQVGYVSLSGGCKNVAVGASPNGDKVYFCDQPGSRIIVMSKKTSTDK
jgi:hypothetical protein